MSDTITVNTNGGYVWVIKCLALCLLLTGCGWNRGLPQPGGVCGGSASAVVASLGYWFAWAGGLAIGASLAAALACAFTGTLVTCLHWIVEIAIGGLMFLLLGTSFLWLSDHMWLLGVVIGLVALFFGVRYRAALARLLHITANPMPKAKA